MRKGRLFTAARCKPSQGPEVLSRLASIAADLAWIASEAAGARDRIARALYPLLSALVDAALEEAGDPSLVGEVARLVERAKRLLREKRYEEAAILLDTLWSGGRDSNPRRTGLQPAP